jgi:hypothetical protein
MVLFARSYAQALSNNSMLLWKHGEITQMVGIGPSRDTPILR